MSHVSPFFWSVSRAKQREYWSNPFLHPLPLPDLITFSAFSFRSSVPPHHLLSFLLFQPTSHLVLYPFTGADNEPHWAMIGFHGISRRVLYSFTYRQSRISLYLFLQGWLMRERFPSSGGHLIRKNIFSNSLQFRTSSAGNIASKAHCLCCLLI